jgi:dynein heavy chain
VGLFATFNPFYKGRSEIPDNLKQIMRPIAMMIPDYATISEQLFFLEGFFLNAKTLAIKTTTLYKLCSQQLSK